MAVFVVSAFWHGFYPSYYVMFFFAAILAQINGDFYKSGIIFSKYIPSKSARYFLAHLFNMLAMNYFGIVFQALTLERTWWFLSETYGFVFIGLALVLAYARMTNMVGRAKKLEAKKTSAEATPAAAEGKK